MEQLGPYTLVEPLGQGTLADVFRAVKTASGGAAPFVVVKRLKPALQAETGFARQWLALARNTLTLAHPNIIPVLDTVDVPSTVESSAASGVVVEQVGGMPLNGVLNHLLTRNRDVPRVFAFTVVQHVLQALKHAHATRDANGRPFIHGEMAPATVMIGLDGQVRVGDFQLGRSRALLKAPENAALKLKYHYMAPEEARDGVVDARSDLYAVGVMLHEMLTFRRLRRGQTPDEQRAQVEAGTWPMLANLNVATDPALDAILSLALQDDPLKRYSSADQFLGDVSRYMASQAMVLSAAQISTLMMTSFPTLKVAEAAARSSLAQSMPMAAPAAAAPAPVVENLGKPKPEQHRPQHRPLPTPGGSIRSKVVMAVAGLLVLLGGSAVGLRMLMRTPTPVQATGTTEQPKDLTRLVGGRSVLFWSEKLSEVDTAIAQTSQLTSDTNHPTLVLLRARRDDLVRKANALGFKELGTAQLKKAE